MQNKKCQCCGQEIAPSITFKQHRYINGVLVKSFQEMLIGQGNGWAKNFDICRGAFKEVFAPHFLSVYTILIASEIKEVQVWKSESKFTKKDVQALYEDAWQFFAEQGIYIMSPDEYKENLCS